MTRPSIHFLILGLVSLTTSSYLDYIPMHHRTSYHALLKQARSLKARSKRQATNQLTTFINKQGCQQTCSKLGQFWARNCFSTSNPLCNSLNDEKKNQQFKCISGCLNSNSPPTPTPQRRPFPKVSIGRPSINAKAQQQVPSNRPSSLEEDTETTSSLPPILAELDQLNLTSADKCRIEGLEDSLACELEHEDPEEAERVFREVFPKLRTRYAENNEQFIKEQTTENPREPQTPEMNKENLSSSREREQEKKHVRFERSVNEIHQKSINDRSRRKRTVADSSDQEICQTSYQISMPFHARHFHTGERVSLYFHRSRDGSNRYAQLFQIGQCQSHIPVINISSSPTRPQCKETKMKVLADVVINVNSVDRKKFRGCVDINPSQALCRDWVLMSNACKLYLPG